MTVSELGRRPFLPAWVVAVFAVSFLALATLCPAQQMRSDDKMPPPAALPPADEDPVLRNTLQRLARERYLFLKRLHETHNVTLYQITFSAAYALFPIGRYDRVYILSDDEGGNGTGTSHLYRYDHKNGKDKFVYAVRLKSTWNSNKPSTWGYKGRIRTLRHVIRQYDSVPVGKVSRFARNDLSREQELVRYTWIPYTDMVNIRLSSRLNDTHVDSTTLTDADTNANRPLSSLLSGNVVRKNGLPISRDELVLIKDR